MTRRPLKLLRLSSLVLCLAVTALWSLSHLENWQLVCSTGQRLWWVRCGQGTIDVSTFRAWPRPERLRFIYGLRPDITDRMPVIQGARAGPFRDWQRWGMSGHYGRVETLLDEQNIPASLTDYALRQSGRGKPLHASAPMAYHTARMPLWMPAALFAVYPAASFALGGARGRTRRRRASQGRCVRCGYDLAGNVSGVCPECGTAL